MHAASASPPGGAEVEIVALHTYLGLSSITWDLLYTKEGLRLLQFIVIVNTV